MPFRFGVILKNEGRLIGDVELAVEDLESHRAHYGYCFNPAYGRKGYATRAVHAVIRYAFEVLGVHKVWAGTDARNERLWRLLERVGMRREGLLRQDLFLKGEWVDDMLYGALRDEWLAEQQSGILGDVLTISRANIEKLE